MQITPDTADTIETLSGGETFVYDDLADPDLNIRYGTFYLRHLLDRFDGNEVAALAAYNGGPENAAAWGGAELEVEDIEFPETRAYVEEVLDEARAVPRQPRRRARPLEAAVDLLVAWVAFPALLTALATGCGLLVDAARRAARCRAPCCPRSGFAAIVVVGQFLTLADATAELATPAVAVALARPGSSSLAHPPRRRPSRWARRRRRGRVRRLRGADRALGRGHLRRLHPPRRHRDLDGADRPGDGARARPRRPGAVDLRGDARLQPRRRLSDRRLPAARRRRASSSARTSPG